MNTEPSATSGSTGELPTISSDQASQTLAAALSSADAGSSQTILSLKMVHQARLSQLKRTAVTLKKQYGADNANVKAAEAAVTLGSTRVAQLSAVHQQVATPTPQVSPNGWALQGRVFSSTLAPVEHLTVFLVDGQNTYQQQYGFVYTDATGYFLINYAGDQPGTPPATTSIFLEIANTSGKPIYLSTTAFVPTIGAATYQNITLPAGEKPIGDPPPSIRDVAIPNPKQDS
jgi:hypothetical protein